MWCMLCYITSYKDACVWLTGHSAFTKYHVFMTLCHSEIDTLTILSCSYIATLKFIEGNFCEP